MDTPDGPKPADGDTGGLQNGKPEVRSSQESGTWYCDLCGGVMIERHCKLVCSVCGYMRDCSDP